MSSPASVTPAEPVATGFSATRMLNKLTEFSIIVLLFAISSYLAYQVSGC
jgi:hypothetical protein